MSKAEPREGHNKAVALMQNKEVKKQVEDLEKALNDVIYLRPIENGLKCISTKIGDNRAMTGILEDDSTKDFYFGEKNG